MKKFLIFVILILVVSTMLFAACGDGTPNNNTSPSPIISTSPSVSPFISPSISPNVSTSPGTSSTK